MSHELRTPLTLLLGPAEDALTDDARAAAAARSARRVEVIDRNAQRLLKLVNTLLDFSRLRVRPAGAAASSRSTSRRYTAELAAMFDSAVDARRARR